MSGDKAQFSEADASQAQEQQAPFNGPNELASGRRADRGEQFGALREIADKPIIAFQNLDAQQKKQFIAAASDCFDTANRVKESVRDVANNVSNQIRNGTPEQAEHSQKWGDSYNNKIVGVLCENFKNASKDIDYHVPIQRQSFFHDESSGKMQHHELAALFPPPNGDTRIVDRYVAVQLHSADPAIEAELRRMPPSLANHVSMDELYFAAVTSNMLPRRERSAKENQRTA